jgi:hypothetical protein
MYFSGSSWSSGLSIWSVAAMSAAPATQVRTFHLNAPLARVFPLFTAQGERAWAPGWEPRILSGSEKHYTTMIEEWRVATSKALRLPVAP